jgi:hypothetical protein
MGVVYSGARVSGDVLKGFGERLAPRRAGPMVLDRAFGFPEGR